MGARDVRKPGLEPLHVSRDSGASRTAVREDEGRDPEVALHRLAGEHLLVLIDQGKLGKLAENRNIGGAPLGAPRNQQTQ
jgi:predicted NUDIX family NTP pyrophosphohydrolase